MLQIDIQQKSYDKNIVLENLHLQILQNGLYGIVGKNGSGKTTFFKCLNRLEKCNGSVLFDNRTLCADQVAFLPTEPYLYEHLTVAEFYQFYAQLVQLPQKKSYIFSVPHDLLIKELSTGMRKKVYLNALLQKEYQLYIFDEPFNGLDIESVYILRKKIKQLAQNQIVFMSSHILESLSDCREIYVLSQKRFQRVLPTEYDKIEAILFQ